MQQRWSVKILDSTGNANVIATLNDVAPKLDADKSYESGVHSSFFHTPDGGGYELFNPYDESDSFIKFEAIENDSVKICIGATDFMTESGTRLIHTLEKIYYTNDNDSDSFTANDELSTIADVPTKLSELTNDSNFVIDASYVHTDSNFTADEKTKLAGLDSNHFKGSYATPSALEAVHPTAEDGDYAYVGTAGTDAIVYIWDNTDSKWVQGGNPTAETPASVKEKYESNEDTNAYDDDDKAKVGTIGNVSNLETTTKSNLVAAINEVVSDLSDYVPKIRTVNGKALSSNITITNSDIGSESAITAGTTSQYWRGDKTWAAFPTTGATVASSYISSSSWYRIWTDGWKEQGGITSSYSGAGYATVTFPTAFTTAISTMVTSYKRSSSAGDYRAVGSVSLTSATVGYDNSYTYWYACGV